MKIRYKHQRFQAEAAKCVSDVFQGQPKHDGSRTFLNKFGALNFDGFGNFPLVLDNESICENVRGIQMAEGLNPVEHLEGDGRTFTIEMETGTGKTYTYIKTMYELNARYGWSKFVIVVPSIAIREGVFKSFESMAEHFAGEYGKRMQYFIYNSKQLAKIDAFASDNGIHAMIINTQAFNASLNEDKNKEGRAGDSAARIIFSRRDEFGSRKPIDILAKTNPILIIDEPQSVLGTDKSNATRKGIKLFNPLFTLLYSATHREIFNQVYRLDAIDAYNKKLVKKIEVRSVHQVGSTATNSYVYLDEIVISKGNPQARLGFDVKTVNGTRQTIRLVGEGFDLKEQSGGLQEYANNFKVECIDGLTNTVHFLNGLTLHPGEVVGSVNEDILRRHQIRETIKTHLERERQLFTRGIKVLSLFFIDHVDSYRIYGKDTAEKGKFARMFEEEYQRALQELMFTFKDTAYTRFLLFDTNILTVIASESYDDFAKKLQTDMAEACASRPVVVTATLFADQLAQTQDGHSIKITTEQAVEIHEELIVQGYIKKGKLTQKYFDEKKADSLQFGEVENLHSFIIKQLDKVFNPDAFKPANGRNKTEAHLVKDNFNKKEWQELWRRINTRTYYNVSFETPKLIKSAIDALDKHLNVTEIRIVVESGGMESIRDREELEAGAAMSAATVKTIRVTEVIGAEVTYDLVGELVQSTGLTRRTIVEMLKGVNHATFHQFKLNPEEFIIKAGRIINDCKAISLIQHIQYEKCAGTFGTGIFEEATLRGTLGKNAIESTKSLYDLVVVDSEGIEKSFAESLEAEDDVVVYSKLPGGFYINTPMGKYNPDWAVAFREDSVKHVYFVAETKGNDIEVSQLRRAEDAKIECARCHFAAISTGDVVYSVV